MVAEPIPWIRRSNRSHGRKPRKDLFSKQEDTLNKVSSTNETKVYDLIDLSGLPSPFKSNVGNTSNVTSREAQTQSAKRKKRSKSEERAKSEERSRRSGVDNSTEKCLDTLRGPDGELPQKLRNIPPHLIENVCNEIMDVHASVRWDDIAGLHHAKKCVNEMAVMPLLRPDLFKGCRSPGKGLMLFGPPGTGKTMIGKAIAGEANATFFYISASSLASKWCGESEQLVRALFGVARCHQPAVIFVDEIDSLLSTRTHHEHASSRKVKTQFLVEMEGFDGGNDQVLLIGATNRPQDLDEAARRRLTKRLYIPLPSSEGRAWIVRNVLEKDGLFKLSEGDIDSICKLTEGYSGSDMTNLVKDAALGPLREALKRCNDLAGLKKEDIRHVTLHDFKDSLREVRPSVSLDELGTYEKWNDQFGSLSTSRTANSMDHNRKRKKLNTSGAYNTSYAQTSNNLDEDCNEIPPPMDQKVAKMEGEATHGVDDTNEKRYKEKMDVLKSINEALHAKNKIDEYHTRLEAEKIKVKEINSLYTDTDSMTSRMHMIYLKRCQEIIEKYNL